LTCAAADPAAEVADWIFGAWQQRHLVGGVLLAAVPEALHARVTEGLTTRFRRLPSTRERVPDALAAVRTLLDGGATLVSGGTEVDQGFQPALFVHVRLSPALADALARPAPVLALAPLEPQAAAWHALCGRHHCLVWGTALESS